MSPAKAGRPVMDLVAGPQGGGKSTFFPVAGRGCDGFNVDDRRTELNSGASRGIPLEVRKRAAADYEAFIEGHVERRRSFAIEVTLAKEITFEQARRARQAGFRIQLTFVGADLRTCIERVANRVDRGGHGVRPNVVRQTYRASMSNLLRAIREFDLVHVYDNARQAGPADADEDARPRLVLAAQHGVATYVAPKAPRWLKTALARRPWG